MHCCYNSDPQYNALLSKRQQEQGPVVNFRKQKRRQSPISISGTAMQRVSSFKFLGVHIREDLTWTEETTQVVKKAQQRLYFGLDSHIHIRTHYTLNLTLHCTYRTIPTSYFISHKRIRHPVHPTQLQILYQFWTFPTLPLHVL